MRGDQREASVIRKAATAVLAAAVVLVGTGCSSSTSGTASPETGDPKGATAALWDPCTQVTDEVLRQVGVDPNTRESGIGGVAVDGWKSCTWHDTPNWEYSLTVWSSVNSIDDLKQKDGNTGFVDTTVAGRSGVQYKGNSGANGEQCFVSFPAKQGIVEVSALNVTTRTSVSACDRVSSAAAVIVPILPR
ncbi:hypothetical protein C5E46_16550 [Nocardia nova]|nr:hypothetical protein C5E46_16550 [Nocardia nova]